MGFSEKIRRQALVACRRRCVICGKFKGTKIEVHHLIPVAMGGSNDFDNAIPLCFDCHADIGQKFYREHAKGTKYSVPELKQQRDKFYKMIENNPKLEISVEAAEKLEIIKQIFDYLFVREKDEIGFNNHYKALSCSYELVYQSLNNAISFECFNELIRFLRNRGYVKTEYLKETKNNTIDGLIYGTENGLMFYVKNFLEA